MSDTRPDGSPREFDEPGRHFTSVDRLEPDAGRDRYHRHLRHLPSHYQHRIVKLGGPQGGPRQSGVLHDALRGSLGREIAEHGAVDAACDRDPFGADDRDVYQVLGTDRGRRPHEVPGLVLVALAASRAVHDGPDSVHRGFDPLASGQLAWIVENFNEWTDAAAELPEDAVDLDQLLTNVSVYWFTGTGASAANFPYETGHSTEWGAPGTAPQGSALFAAQPFVREMMDPDYEIEHWSEFDRGDHFAAMETQDLLVGDVCEFFRTLR
jgi:hypothetical protein